MKKTHQLVTAHILLQCHDPTHKVGCFELIQSLVDKFGDVERAQVIRQIDGDGDFCVFAVATIITPKLELFRSALSKHLCNGKPGSKVKDVNVNLESDTENILILYQEPPTIEDRRVKC